MTAPKLTILFLLFSLFSCGQKEIKRHIKHKVDPRAESLYEQTIELSLYQDEPDSCKKALSLLDSATAIDDSCFFCYWNKLMFLDTLKQLDKFFSVYRDLLRLHPRDHVVYMMRGSFYERKGDTISSKKDFRKSLEICESVLDTMSSKNKSYESCFLDRALLLIMLNEQEKGHKLLKQLCEKHKGDPWGKFYCSLLNKSKKELLTPWSWSQDSSSSTEIMK